MKEKIMSRFLVVSILAVGLIFLIGGTAMAQRSAFIDSEKIQANYKEWVKAQEQFNEARNERKRIKENFDKFYTNLREIKTVLDNDLNPAGVESMEKFIATAKENAGPVKEDIDKIIAVLKEVSSALKAGGPPPEKK